MKHLNRGRAFTLLELLAVIFIIAIVTAVLLPTMHQTRSGNSNRVKCGRCVRTKAYAARVIEEAQGVE